jgi:hypothetical protein
MFLMFLFCFRVYKDIVNEDHNELVQIFHKYVIHEIHEIGRGIHKSKGHYGLLIQSISGVEHCLGNIRLLNSQLVITRSQINLGEDTHSFHLVKQIIDPWERILILDGDFNQGPVVYTHPLSSVLLRHK